MFQSRALAHQAHKQRGATSIASVLVAGGIGIAFGLLIFIFGIWSTITGNQTSQQLLASPISTSGDSSISTNDRLRIPATVVDKSCDYGQNGAARDYDCTIILRTDNGSTYTALFDYGGDANDQPAVYRMAPIGSQVEIEVWHGQVMWVAVGTVKDITDSYPQPQGGRLLAIIGLILTLVVLFAVIKKIRNLMSYG